MLQNRNTAAIVFKSMKIFALPFFYSYRQPIDASGSARLSPDTDFSGA
jgi:hypothetical protein